MDIYKLIELFEPLREIEILSIKKNINDVLMNRFKRAKRRSMIKYKNVKVRILFHLTNNNSGKLIAQNGFDVSRGKTKAYGKGIYFTDKIIDLKRYLHHIHDKDESGSVTIMVCCVIIGKAHLNYSDPSDLRYFEKYGYSRPKYMSPRKGYDSMYTKDGIWIIPVSSRIYPKYLVKIKWT